MGRGILGRIAALVVALIAVAAFAVFVAERSQTGTVGAQAQPTAGTSIIQRPPPVPGLDYTPPEPGQATIPVAATTTGTPVAADPSTVAAPTSGGSVTASLGGSDIAVSSVGGSYERDVPNKRRGDRESRK